MELTLSKNEQKLASDISKFLKEQENIESDLSKDLIRLSLDAHKRNKRIDLIDNMAVCIKEVIVKNFSGESELLNSPYFDLISNVASAIYNSEQQHGSMKATVLAVISQVGLDMAQILQELKDLDSYNANK